LIRAIAAQKRSPADALFFRSGIANPTTEQIALRISPAYLIAVAGALLLGVVIRLGYVLASDFPLGDGGLFFAMAQDLRASSFTLPLFTTYNGGEIPFAYPPLAIYSAALLGTWQDLTGVFRVLPLLASSLSIIAFGALAHRLLPSRIATVAAIYLFAILPGTYQQTLMGGGLTRSFGLLFALTALHQAHVVFTAGRRRHVAIAAISLAAAVLSHPSHGWFAAYSVVLAWLALDRTQSGTLRLFTLGVLALLLSAPWWAVVLHRHGLAPFLSAFGTDMPQMHPLFGVASRVWSRIDTFAHTHHLGVETGLPVVGSTALFGLFTCLTARRLQLPLWLFISMFVAGRNYLEESTIFVALLGAVGCTWVVIPVLDGARRSLRGLRGGQPFLADEAARSMLRLRPVRYGVIVLAVLSTLSSIGANDTILVTVTPDERGAMAWAKANTPPESRFLVFSQDRWDPQSEWFPVLAGRHSVGTIQGLEWVPGSYVPTERDIWLARRCGSESADCLERWLGQSGRAFTHVFVPGPPAQPLAEDCCAPLRRALELDPRYRQEYDGRGAAIFERTVAGIDGGR
jgi:hypothetical protein